MTEDEVRDFWRAMAQLIAQNRTISSSGGIPWSSPIANPLDDVRRNLAAFERAADPQAEAVGIVERELALQATCARNGWLPYREGEIARDHEQEGNDG